MPTKEEKFIYFFMDETGSIGDKDPIISCGLGILNLDNINILLKKYLLMAKKDFPYLLNTNNGVLHFTDILENGHVKFLTNIITELSKEDIRIFYYIDKKTLNNNNRGKFHSKKTPLKYLFEYLLFDAWDWRIIKNTSGIKVFCDKGYYEKYSREILTESRAVIYVSGPDYNPTLTITVPHGIRPKEIYNKNFEIPEGNYTIKNEIVNKNHPGLQMADIVCGALRQKFIKNQPSFIEPLQNKIHIYKERNKPLEKS